MIKFITNGSLVDIKQGTDAGGYNVVASLNSNSKNITWGYGSDTSRINFTIDDKAFDSIPATDIYFDGVALSSATGFKAAIEGMFPNLAGGGGTSSYLVYTALLSQSGTNAPTATVLENTLTDSLTWFRDAEGNYYASCATFTNNKSWCVFQGNGCYNGSAPFVWAEFLFNEVGYPTKILYMRVRNALNDNSIDDWGAPIFIEIRVYP